MYARGAVGRVAPHCAVVFNSCLTTRLGADVRTPGTRQRQGAEAGGRRQEAGGRRQRQEAGGRNPIQNIDRRQNVKVQGEVSRQSNFGRMLDFREIYIISHNF